MQAEFCKVSLGECTVAPSYILCEIRNVSLLGLAPQVILLLFHGGE